MKRTISALAIAVTFASTLAGCAGGASSFAGSTWYTFDAGEDANSPLVELRFNDDATLWSLTGDQSYSGDAEAEGDSATLSALGHAWRVVITDDEGGSTLELDGDTDEDSMPQVFKNGGVFYDSAEDAQAARSERLADIEEFVESTLFDSTLILRETVYHYGSDPEIVDFARLAFHDDGSFEAEAINGDPETIVKDYLLPLGAGTYEISYDDTIPASDYKDNGIKVRISFNEGRGLVALVSDAGVSWDASGSYKASFFLQ